MPTKTRKKAAPADQPPWNQETITQALDTIDRLQQWAEDRGGYFPFALFQEVSERLLDAEEAMIARKAAAELAEAEAKRRSPSHQLPTTGFSRSPRLGEADAQHR